MSGVERIGNQERESAVAALQLHHGAGRLSSAEYEDRSVDARAAKTWEDLGALFTDLPAPGPAEIRANHVDQLRPAAAVEPRVSEPPAQQHERHGGWIPEPYGYMVTALAPIAAVVLFFVTSSWLWFLLIPAVGIVVYGPEGDPKKRAKDQAKAQAREDRRRRRQGS